MGDPSCRVHLKPRSRRRFPHEVLGDGRPEIPCGRRRGARGDETRTLYADKVVRIRWQKSFEVDQDYGHHFDNVKAAFIRDHVAPLLVVVE